MNADILSYDNVKQFFDYIDISPKSNSYMTGRFKGKNQTDWIMVKIPTDLNYFWFVMKNVDVIIDNTKNEAVIIDRRTRKFVWTNKNGKVKSINKLKKILNKYEGV